MTEENKNNGKDFDSVQNWKMSETNRYKELELERDKWRTDWTSIDKELKQAKKTIKEKEEELEDWERKDLNGKAPKNKEQENLEEAQKKERLNRFLNRIK